MTIRPARIRVVRLVQTSGTGRRKQRTIASATLEAGCNSHFGTWLGTPSRGKPDDTVPPQKRYYLPGAWLKSNELNELVIFDEHGNPPNKVKITYVEGAF